jgi:hypothetical protein
LSDEDRRILGSPWSRDIDILDAPLESTTLRDRQLRLEKAGLRLSIDQKVPAPTAAPTKAETKQI